MHKSQISQSTPAHSLKLFIRLISTVVCITALGATQALAGGLEPRPGKGAPKGGTAGGGSRLTHLTKGQAHLYVNPLSVLNSGAKIRGFME
jgi:hypothetical protein